MTPPPQAFWNQNGVTVAGWANGTAGSSLSQLNQPLGISITSNDVMYICDRINHRIVVVHLNSTVNYFAIGSGLGSGPNQFNYPYDLFVTNTSLYVIDANNRRVQKSSLNGSDPITALNFGASYDPIYLYVDNNDSIYLSDNYNHRVVLFYSNSANGEIVAGTNVLGSNNDQLHHPYGICVNPGGTIYIADYNNHRIMKWLRGAKFGVRVAGDGTNGHSSTQLSHPTQVIVDENENMYISERDNARITLWRPDSAYGICIIACTGTSGTASTQLKEPHSLAFDSDGSLYVSDWGNNRVQKFQILPYHSE